MVDNNSWCCPKIRVGNILAVMGIRRGYDMFNDIEDRELQDVLRPSV